MHIQEKAICIYIYMYTYLSLFIFTGIAKLLRLKRWSLVRIVLEGIVSPRPLLLQVDVGQNAELLGPTLPWEGNDAHAPSLPWEAGGGCGALCVSGCGGVRRHCTLEDSTTRRMTSARVNYALTTVVTCSLQFGPKAPREIFGDYKSRHASSVTMAKSSSSTVAHGAPNSPK